VFVSSAGAESLVPDRPPPEVDLREVLLALQEVMRRAEMFTHHRIERESLSLRERMSLVLGAVRPDRFTSLSDLLDIREGRMGVVITFLAVLELIKASLVELVQAEPYAPIYVKAASGIRDDAQDGESELDSDGEAASYG